MKKTLTFLALAVFAMTSVIGCSSNSNAGFESGVATTEGTTTIETTKASEKETTTEATTTTTAPQQAENFEIRVLGTLYQLMKTDDPVIPRIQLLAWSGYASIGMDGYLDENIRCLFEVDESIYIRVFSYTKDPDLYVVLVPHNKDSSYYDSSFVSNTKYNLEHIKWTDEGESIALIETDPKVYSTGYYDMVFLKKTTPIAVMKLKLYRKGAIKKSKLDSDKLMEQEIAKSKNEGTPAPTKKPAKKPKKKK